jgi:hypothetical protein
VTEVPAHLGAHIVSRTFGVQVDDLYVFQLSMASDKRANDGLRDRAAGLQIDPLVRRDQHCGIL